MPLVYTIHTIISEREPHQRRYLGCEIGTLPDSKLRQLGFYGVRSKGDNELLLTADHQHWDNLHRELLDLLAATLASSSNARLSPGREQFKVVSYKGTTLETPFQLLRQLPS